MKTKKTILSFIFLTICIEAIGQISYDTLVKGSTSYEKLSFKFQANRMIFYEVNDIDINIQNGEIKKIENEKDTIGLWYFNIDKYNDGYEIHLSAKNWNKILFGKDCKNLKNQVNQYPHLKFKRSSKSKNIAFIEPKTIGEFLKISYKKRIECIEDSEDKYMKEYLVHWIRMIEHDSIDEFTTAFTSYWSHIFALHDIIVPKNNKDTIIYTVSAKNLDEEIAVSFKTEKQINPDSTITYHHTDKIDSENSLNKVFLEKLYKTFQLYESEDEKIKNEIRLKSMSSEDKSIIELTKTHEFKRYLRIVQSYILDTNLNPKQSIHNFEIKKIGDN